MRGYANSSEPHDSTLTPVIAYISEISRPHAPQRDNGSQASFDRIQPGVQLVDHEKVYMAGRKRFERIEVRMRLILSMWQGLRRDERGERMHYGA